MRYLVLYLLIGIIGIASCKHKSYNYPEPKSQDSIQTEDSLIVPKNTWGDSLASYVAGISFTDSGSTYFYISFREKYTHSEPSQIYFRFIKRPNVNGTYKVVSFPNLDAADEVNLEFMHSGVYGPFLRNIDLPENGIMLYINGNNKLHLVGRSVKLKNFHSGDTSAIFFNLTES